MAEVKPPISTFIFTKINTTGRSWLAQPESITEVCMIAIPREDIINGVYEKAGYNKFETLINPGEPMSEEAALATALTDADLVKAPYFAHIIKPMTEFLNECPKPSCLVAYNAKSFDIKILKSHYEIWFATYPADLLVADFRWIFHRLLKNEPKGKRTIEAIHAIIFGQEIKKLQRARPTVNTMIKCAYKRTGFVEVADLKCCSIDFKKKVRGERATSQKSRKRKSDENSDKTIPAGQKTTKKKTDGEKNRKKKAVEKKSNETLAEQGSSGHKSGEVLINTVGQNISGEKTVEVKSEDQNSFGKKSIGIKSELEKSSGEESNDMISEDENSYGEESNGIKSEVENSYGEESIDIKSEVENSYGEESNDINSENEDSFGEESKGIKF